MAVQADGGLKFAIEGVPEIPRSAAADTRIEVPAATARLSSVRLLILRRSFLQASTWELRDADRARSTSLGLCGDASGISVAADC